MENQSKNLNSDLGSVPGVLGSDASARSGSASVKLPDFRDFLKFSVFEELFVDSFEAFLNVF